MDWGVEQILALGNAGQDETGQHPAILATEDVCLKTIANCEGSFGFGVQAMQRLEEEVRFWLTDNCWLHASSSFQRSQYGTDAWCLTSFHREGNIRVGANEHGTGLDRQSSLSYCVPG